MALAVSRFVALIDRLSDFVGGIAAVLIAAIAVLILSEICARAVFNYSLSFAWEYSSYCMAAVVFCGAAFTLRTGGHVRVSLLASSVPARLAWATDVLATVLGFAIATFIAYAMTQLAIDSLASGSRSPTSTATPLIIPQAGIAIGCMLFVLQLLARLGHLLLGQASEFAGTENEFALKE